MPHLDIHKHINNEQGENNNLRNKEHMAKNILNNMKNKSTDQNVFMKDINRSKSKIS